MIPPLALAPATLTAAYEQARAWATGHAAPGPRPAGLAVLLRRGLVGWLEQGPRWLAGAPEAPHPSRPSGTPAVTVDALAGVLATMIAAGQQEASA
jgi:hypothetical protein